MHILFIPKWYPGRADPQLGDFLRKQAIAVGKKARVSVLHVSPIMDLEQDEVQEVSDRDGIWELRCMYKSSAVGNSAIRKAANFPRYWRAAIRGFNRIVKERGMPDINHVHILVRPAVLAWRWKEKYGIPIVISEQSSEYLDGTFAKKNALFKWWSRFLFSEATAITVVSKWLGEALISHRLTDRYNVVPNVIPGLERPLPPPGDPKHFMVVADLVDKTKNVSGVIRALSRAIETEPSLRLSIIGDGPDRKMLEDLVRSHELNGKVQFLGRMANSEVLDHMANTGSVIINSNVETFSVVTGEALAQGKPVIATRCGGPIAFVTPENGILIGIKDDTALAKAMLEISSTSGSRSPEKIRQSVSDRFSYEAVGAAFFRIYERVLHVS